MKYYVAQRDTKSKGLPDIVSVVGSKIRRHNVFSLTESPELRYRDVTDRQRHCGHTSLGRFGLVIARSIRRSAAGECRDAKGPRFSQFQPSRPAAAVTTAALSH